MILKGQKTLQTVPANGRQDPSGGTVFSEDRLDAPEISISASAPVSFDPLTDSEPLELSDVTENIIDLGDFIDDESLYEDLDRPVQARQSFSPLNSIFLTSFSLFSLKLSPNSKLQAAPGDLIYIDFLLENRGGATKFLISAGAGGEVTQTQAVRERMVFPGEVSFIQTISPEMILLNTNDSSTISMGVSICHLVVIF